MVLDMHFENCFIHRAPVLGLLVSLSIYVELVHTGLDITLVLDDQKSILEFLSEDCLISAVSLAWWLSASSTDL